MPRLFTDRVQFHTQQLASIQRYAAATQYTSNMTTSLSPHAHSAMQQKIWMEKSIIRLRQR